jgi:hypothetical protein
MEPKVDVSYIIKKLKEEQPHVWETQDFVDFLENCDSELQKIAKNFR